MIRYWWSKFTPKIEKKKRMRIIEVNPTKKNWRLFHKVPHEVYKNNSFWICPLENEIDDIFNPTENKAFRESDTKFFVLLDEKNVPKGRIVAFVDHVRNKERNVNQGGIGFFECIHNMDYAKALFDKAFEFFEKFDLDFIDGPINLGERDKFWGLLTNYFDRPPLYQENYNPSYYVDFFKAFGFEPLEQILTLKGKVADIPFDRIARIAQRLRERSPVKTEIFDFNQLDHYAKDFSIAYNGAFGMYEHFKPVTPEQVKKLMEQAKAIADPTLVCVAYYDNKPAGFAALFPEINPLIKVTKGKLNWRTLPLLLFKKWTKRYFDIKGMAFGVRPEYQTKGVYSLLVDKMGSEMDREKYKDLYLCTIRAHNTIAVSSYKKLITQPERVHYTMRKSIRPGLSVEPFKFISI